MYPEEEGSSADEKVLFLNTSKRPTRPDTGKEEKMIHCS
jgi:hypothetical protein